MNTNFFVSLLTNEIRYIVYIEIEKKNLYVIRIFIETQICFGITLPINKI